MLTLVRIDQRKKWPEIRTSLWASKPCRLFSHQFLGGMELSTLHWIDCPVTDWGCWIVQPSSFWDWDSWQVWWTYKSDAAGPRHGFSGWLEMAQGFLGCIFDGTTYIVFQINLSVYHPGMVRTSSLVARSQHMSLLLYDQRRFRPIPEPFAGNAQKKFSKFLSACPETRGEKCLGDDYNDATIIGPSTIQSQLKWDRGVLTQLPFFHPQMIKFCSMHSLNLGYGLWLCGGAIVWLVEETNLFGGDDLSLEERFQTAWVTFDQWAKRNKIQYFNCTSWWGSCQAMQILRIVNMDRFHFGVCYSGTLDWGTVNPDSSPPALLAKMSSQNFMRRHGMYLGVEPNYLIASPFLASHYCWQVS